MDDFSKILQEALGGEQTGRTLITGRTKEELLGKLVEHLQAEESSATAEEEEEEEAERLTQQAFHMTAQDAARMATSALIGAGREFADGHEKCAQFKMDAGAVWLSLSEHMLRLEERAEIMRQRAQAEESMKAWEASLPPEPVANLGAATTRELLAEMETRFSITTPNKTARGDISLMIQQLDAETLNYRPIDPEQPDSGNEE